MIKYIIIQSRFLKWQLLFGNDAWWMATYTVTLHVLQFLELNGYSYLVT